MPLLSRPIRYFYSTEKRTSEAQLRQDFGDFPPKPLDGSGLTGEFITVRVRGIGEHFHHVVMIKRLVEGAANMDTLTLSIRNHMPEDLAAFKKFGQTNGIGKKMQLWIGLAAVFVARFLKLTRMAPQSLNSLGFYAPFRKDEHEIVIKVGRVAKKRLDIAAMISHEHIHLLQHKSENAEPHSRNARWSDDQLFTDFARANAILPHLKYILEKHEVEARLHEVVVSFYRAHKDLPFSVPSFLALLASGRQFGDLISETLTAANVDFGPVLGEFTDRDKMQARDLELVLLSMPHELTLRFITEVLPVMYGNLLKYYGDGDASRNFLTQIRRPNFYDELYSLPAAMPAECNTP